MRTTAAAALLLVVTVPARGADWQPVATNLLAREKPGYGGLSGVVVDRANGHVYVDVSDRGVFRSADRGGTWEQVGSVPIKGRTETPGCFQIDPTGRTKRLLLPLVYGSPILVGSDKGDWRTEDEVSTHVDWCAADWSDPELKFQLTLKHESGGVLLASRDGGKSFAEVGKGYGFGWVFDADTAVVSLAKTKDRPAGGVVRTTDGGKTFMPVADFTPNGLPRWHDGTLYWLAGGSLCRTADKGATWAKVGAVKDARYGPVFGAKTGHLFVLTGAGVVESTDGGATWADPIPLPKGLGGVSGLAWLEYDPATDTLYVMKMTSDLYRLTRTR